MASFLLIEIGGPCLLLITVLHLTYQLLCKIQHLSKEYEPVETCLSWLLYILLVLSLIGLLLTPRPNSRMTGVLTLVMEAITVEGFMTRVLRSEPTQLPLLRSFPQQVYPYLALGAFCFFFALGPIPWATVLLGGMPIFMFGTIWFISNLHPVVMPRRLGVAVILVIITIMIVVAAVVALHHVLVFVREVVAEVKTFDVGLAMRVVRGEFSPSSKWDQRRPPQPLRPPKRLAAARVSQSPGRDWWKPLRPTGNPVAEH